MRGPTQTRDSTLDTVRSALRYTPLACSVNQSRVCVWCVLSDSVIDLPVVCGTHTREREMCVESRSTAHGAENTAVSTGVWLCCETKLESSRGYNYTRLQKASTDAGSNPETEISTTEHGRSPLSWWTTACLVAVLQSAHACGQRPTARTLRPTTRGS